MTTPSTNLGASSIQTEFGGSNPIALSEYYQGAGYVPNGQATSSVDGSPVPTSGQIRFGEFRNLSAAPPVTYPVNGYNIMCSQSNYPSGGTTCNVSIHNDGTIGHGGSGGGTKNFYTGPTSWISPTGSGIGAGYEFIVDTKDLSLGTANGPALGSWSSLSGNFSFSASAASNHAVSCTWGCRIRNASTQVVVASFSIDLELDNT